MNLKLTRKTFTEKSTIGELSVDDVRECFTLEDRVRPKKIKGQTAIPAGTYQVIIDFSNRFQRLMPLLINVPNFAGVRIHAGNTYADTEGCILVGQNWSKDFIGNSRPAYAALFKKLQAAYKKEKIFLEIVEERN